MNTAERVGEPEVGNWTESVTMTQTTCQQMPDDKRQTEWIYKKEQDGNGLRGIKQAGRIERALKSLTHPVAF